MDTNPTNLGLELNDGNAFTKLGGLNSGALTRRATADTEEVKVVCCAQNKLPNKYCRLLEL